MRRKKASPRPRKNPKARRKKITDRKDVEQLKQRLGPGFVAANPPKQDTKHGDKITTYSYAEMMKQSFRPTSSVDADPRNTDTGWGDKITDPKDVGRLKQLFGQEFVCVDPDPRDKDTEWGDKIAPDAPEPPKHSFRRF